MMKVGTKVKMVNCIEAEENEGKVWVTRSEPWAVCGSTVVLLEGKRGGFDISCLQVVDESEADVNEALGLKE